MVCERSDSVPVPEEYVLKVSTDAIVDNRCWPVVGASLRGKAGRELVASSLSVFELGSRIVGSGLEGISSSIGFLVC